jgi:hypothetical protein
MRSRLAQLSFIIETISQAAFSVKLNCLKKLFSKTALPSTSCMAKRGLQKAIFFLASPLFIPM